MKSVIILSVATLATVFAAATVEPKQEKTTKGAQAQVKTEAGEGHRNGGYYNGGYNQYPYYGGPQFLPPVLQDRYICDLDASVLLITQHQNRHHFGGPARAVRVKCSEVASYDEDSCNLCCQQTARRDTTLANDKLFGFLAITSDDQHHHQHKPSGPETFSTRTKRDAEDVSEEVDEDNEDHDSRQHHTQPTYLKNDDWKPKKYHTNVKCVCCAPKPAPVVFAAPVAQTGATYGNVAAAAPAASTTYGAAPAASQPIYDSYGAWGAAADTTSTSTSTSTSY